MFNFRSVFTMTCALHRVRHVIDENELGRYVGVYININLTE